MIYLILIAAVIVFGVAVILISRWVRNRGVAPTGQVETQAPTPRPPRLDRPDRQATPGAPGAPPVLEEPVAAEPADDRVARHRPPAVARWL